MMIKKNHKFCPYCGTEFTMKERKKLLREKSFFCVHCKEKCTVIYKKQMTVYFLLAFLLLCLLNCLLIWTTMNFILMATVTFLCVAAVYECRIFLIRIIKVSQKE